MNKISLLKIKQLMKDQGYTLESFGELIGYKKSMMSQLLKGAKSLKMDKLIEIASVLRVDASDLLEGEHTSFVTIPVVGVASCGVPNGSYDDAIDFIKVPSVLSKGAGLYAVVADGDSMLPDIKSGDLVVCAKDMEINHGDFVHYSINGESGIKKCGTNQNECLLIPTNSEYDVIKVNEGDELTVTRVMQVIKSY